MPLEERSKGERCDYRRRAVVLPSPMHDVRRSKRLSYWLRHAPEAGGLQLDREGWAEVDEVLRAFADGGLPTGMAELRSLVASNDKQRFELSPDGCRIRARQGHSIRVEGEWPITEPPQWLFHGTVERFLASILERGLLAGKRHHVHLSATIETARLVGARRGASVVLQVAATRMTDDGHSFRLSSNGVWLTDHVPPIYLARIG